VWERGGSDVAVLDGSGTIVSQGFNWYMNQLETRTRTRSLRTEEDCASGLVKETAAPEKFWEEAEKKKEKYYIESRVSCT